MKNLIFLTFSIILIIIFVYYTIFLFNDYDKNTKNINYILEALSHPDASTKYLSKPSASQVQVEKNLDERTLTEELKNIIQKINNLTIFTFEGYNSPLQFLNLNIATVQEAKQIKKITSYRERRIREIQLMNLYIENKNSKVTSILENINKTKQALKDYLLHLNSNSSKSEINIVIDPAPINEKISKQINEAINSINTSVIIKRILTTKFQDV